MTDTMQRPQAYQPIGIFDSGIGGLTVAKAVMTVLPNESIVYFGDTAHLPYGDKSSATIQAYSVKIAHMLLQQNCKLILIACNSASTAAYELIKEYVASKAIVMNVVDPTIQFLREHSTGRFRVHSTVPPAYSELLVLGSVFCDHHSRTQARTHGATRTQVVGQPVGV